MHLCSIVGARPQFVKLAAICNALKAHRRWTHTIIHTGQHYDPALSQVFFDELDIPAPDFHLDVGSGTHGHQVGEMLKRLETALFPLNPDWVVLFGDTNSTLAGAIIGSRLGLRLAHIEAGLRSHRRIMPEEANRIVADHLSDLLLCPTKTALRNLKKEGLDRRTVFTGDVMFDAAVTHRHIAEQRGSQLADEWRPQQFALATVHRQENTDNPARLRSIVDALDQIARSLCPVVWPVHPRTRKRLAELNISVGAAKLIDPVSYLDMLLLEGRARVVLTDSGGVQKEAYFLRVPCVTLRDETEWEETLKNRCNILAGATPSTIVAAASANDVGPWTAEYGHGHAAETVLRALERHA